MVHYADATRDINAAYYGDTTHDINVAYYADATSKIRVVYYPDATNDIRLGQALLLKVDWKASIRKWDEQMPRRHEW